MGASFQGHGISITSHDYVPILTSIYIINDIYIYEIGSSYTFKPLNLSRSNGQKKIIINANILINLIYYPLFNTFHTYL